MSSFTWNSLTQTCEKWDLCYGRVLEDVAKRPPKTECTESDEEVYEQLTGDSTKKTKPFKFAGGGGGGGGDDAANKPGSDEPVSTPEEDLYSAVSESTSKLCIHYMGLIKKLLAVGDVQTLLKVFAGLSLMRNKLWQYNETLTIAGKPPKAFKEEYDEVVMMMESVAEHVETYNLSLASTNVLHEPAGHDWENEKAFFEGEKVSHCIQMWWYYLQVGPPFTHTCLE